MADEAVHPINGRLLTQQFLAYNGLGGSLGGQIESANDAPLGKDGEVREARFGRWNRDLVRLVEVGAWSCVERRRCHGTVPQQHRPGCELADLAVSPSAQAGGVTTQDGAGSAPNEKGKAVSLPLFIVPARQAWRARSGVPLAYEQRRHDTHDADADHSGPGPANHS
jgi:hypothetical protein